MRKFLIIVFISIVSLLKINGEDKIYTLSPEIMNLLKSYEAFSPIHLPYSDLILKEPKSGVNNSYLFLVKSNGKIGVVNINNGEIILPCIYNQIDGIDGIIMTKKYANNKSQYSLFNNDGKEIVTTGKYDFKPWKYNYGVIDSLLVPVRRENKWGFINKNGDEVIPCNYQELIGNPNISNNLVAVKENNKVGLFKNDGSILLPIEYNSIKVEDYNFPGEDEQSDRTFYGVGLPYHGKKWIGNSFPFIKINNEYKILDIEDLKLIDPKYNELEFINDNLFCFKKGSKLGIIDKLEKEITEAKYDSIFCFQDEMAVVKRDSLWGYVNKNGREIIPCKYTKAYDFLDGIAVVIKDDKFGCVNKQGEEICSFIFDNIVPLGDGLAKVTKNNKRGIINKEGEFLIPDLTSDYLNNYLSGYIINSNDNNKYGVIDIRGNQIIPKVYSDLDNLGNGLFWGRIGNQYFLLDTHGNKVTSSECIDCMAFDSYD